MLIVSQKIKGDQINQLAFQLHLYGHNQKYIVHTMAKTVQHQNVLIEKALEKQFLMENRIGIIENKLRKRKNYQYQKNERKIEKLKIRQQKRELLRDFKFNPNLLPSYIKNGDAKDLDEDDISIDSDGYEDDQQKKTQQLITDFKTQLIRQKLQSQDNEDPLKAYYLNYKLIQQFEDRSKRTDYQNNCVEYIRLGKEQTMAFIRMKNDINWRIGKSSKNFKIYHPKIKSKSVYFKIEAVISHPVTLVQEYMMVSGKNIDKKMIWAYQNYDDVRVVKEFQMNTYLIYQQLKKQWPMQWRYSLVCAQSVKIAEDQYIFTQKSVTHKSHPESNKYKVANIKQDSYFLKPCEDNPNKTQLTYIGKFDFQTLMPNSILQECLEICQIQSLIKLNSFLTKIQNKDKIQFNF